MKNPKEFVGSSWVPPPVHSLKLKYVLSLSPPLQGIKPRAPAHARAKAQPLSPSPTRGELAQQDSCRPPSLSGHIWSCSVSELDANVEKITSHDFVNLGITYVRL